MSRPNGRVAAVAVATLLLAGGGLRAQCIALNVYEPDAYEKGKSIAVGLFAMEGDNFASNAGPLEKPRQILVESMREDLVKSKYFSSVNVVAADEATTADYLLEGEIVGIHGGDRTFRIFIGGLNNAGQMRVTGRFYGPAKVAGDKETRPLISDWECNSADMGGAFGLGSNETAAKKNADKISKDLSKRVLGKMEKRLDKLAKKVANDAEEKPLRGKTESKNRKWREKQEWDVDDYLDEIDSFVATSDRERSRGIDVLWLVRPAYEANTKVLPLLKKTTILRSSEIGRGMLRDIRLLQEFEGQDVLAFALTFNVSINSAPFLWDSDRLKEATYLYQGDDPRNRVAPIEFLDRKLPSYVVFREKKLLKAFSSMWAFHPVVVIFPNKKADGTPLVTRLDDVIQLHTEVDGRPALLTFNLGDFDLGGLDDLKLGSATMAAK